ncbi:hypothetical protein AZI11_00640 [Levilactobacillus brevis]|nr:hypothetical protein AZI11_00640 [Levilactobacillus brevis]ARN94250.1 hypothetical protein AZI12_00645 [Levilactobacillus brevis]
MLVVVFSARETDVAVAWAVTGCTLARVNVNSDVESNKMGTFKGLNVMFNNLLYVMAFHLKYNE